MRHATRPRRVALRLDYLHRGKRPEEIAATYPSLSLEQVYATITYYLHNREAIDRYMTEWTEHGERMRAEQAKNPTPTMRRLARLMAERRAAGRWPPKESTGVK